MKPAREFVTDFLITFALTFTGGAALLQTRNVDAAYGALEVALAHGLVLAVMLATVGRASGCGNPALTLGLLVARRITPVQVLVFIAGQVAGAITAALLLKGLFPTTLWEAARGTRQLVSLDVTTVQAFALEAVAAFLLMLVVLGSTGEGRSAGQGGMAIGLALTTGMLAIGPLTGGSLNPARTLGPMVATGVYEGVALYAVAPVVGAIVAALLHTLLLHERERA